ncbi:MAG: TerB family tellurite resistance protein [Rhizobiaceae bacterium]
MVSFDQQLIRQRETDHQFPARSAVAYFLFMVMPSDGHQHPHEHQRLARILSDDFDLGQQQVEDLIEHASGHAFNDEVMQQLAGILLVELEHEELIDLISHMWEMVFADGRMHETEVVFVERVAQMLNFPQEEVTKAMTL